MYIYTYMYVCVCVCDSVCVYMYVYTMIANYKRSCLSVYIYAYMCIYTCMYMYMCLCDCVCVYTIIANFEYRCLSGIRDAQYTSRQRHTTTCCNTL